MSLFVNVFALPLVNITFARLSPAEVHFIISRMEKLVKLNRVRLEVLKRER